MKRIPASIVLASIASIVLASIGCVSSVVSIPAPASPPLAVSILASSNPAPAPTPRVVMTTVTAARSVNIREKATEHSDVLGNLWHGEVVYVSRCSGKWARIREGWVNSYYLDGVCP